MNIITRSQGTRSAKLTEKNMIRRKNVKIRLVFFPYLLLSSDYRLSTLVCGGADIILFDPDISKTNFKIRMVL